MGPFKMCIIQERGKEWLTKNLQKASYGEGSHRGMTSMMLTYFAAF